MIAQMQWYDDAHWPRPANNNTTHEGKQQQQHKHKEIKTTHEHQESVQVGVVLMHEQQVGLRF